jgi:hypothetical protein
VDQIYQFAEPCASHCSLPTSCSGYDLPTETPLSSPGVLTAATLEWPHVRQPDFLTQSIDRIMSWSKVS